MYVHEHIICKPVCIAKCINPRHIYIYIHIDIDKYINFSIYLYMYMYIYMYANIYTHTLLLSHGWRTANATGKRHGQETNHSYCMTSFQEHTPLRSQEVLDYMDCCPRCGHQLFSCNFKAVQRTQNQ